MLENFPKKKKIVFMTNADEGYVSNNDGKYNNATQECLIHNKDQIIKVAIITGRNASKFSVALLNKTPERVLSEGEWNKWKKNGLDAVEKDIISQLGWNNDNGRSVDICIPNDLIPVLDRHGDCSARKPGESYEKFREIEIETLKQNFSSAYEYLMMNSLENKIIDDDNKITELGAGIGFGKGNQVKFYLNSLVSDEEMGASKIYMDGLSSNVVEVFENNQDVISVLNNIEMGYEYNKHALDLAIKAANSDSEEEILEIKKTLIKAALEFEELSTGLGLQNLKNIMMNSVQWEGVDMQNPIDWFQVIRNLLDEEQKQRVEIKFAKAEENRESNLASGKTSPISVESSDDVKQFKLTDDSFISLNPGSSRRVGGESAIGTFDWGANYDKEAGASFSSTPLTKKELPLRGLEPENTLASRTGNARNVFNRISTKASLQLSEREGGLLRPNILFREEEPPVAPVDSSLQVAAGARSEDDSAPIVSDAPQSPKITLIGEAVHKTKDDLTSILFGSPIHEAGEGGHSLQDSSTHTVTPYTALSKEPDSQGAAGARSEDYSITRVFSMPHFSPEVTLRSVIGGVLATKSGLGRTSTTPKKSPPPVGRVLDFSSKGPETPDSPLSPGVQPHQPKSSSSFFATCKNDIIKFKIKSGPENSGEKFYYNRKPDDIKSNPFKEGDYTPQKEQEKIVNILVNASEATKQKFSNANLDDNFFIAVMRVASEKCGIASIKSEEEFNKVLTSFVPTLDTSKYTLQDGDTLYKIAKYFSAQFQSSSEDNKYFTAREGAKGEFNNTGRRLFRVCTEENIKAFQEKQKELAIISPPQPQKLEAVSASSPSTSPRRVEKPKGSSTSPDLVYARVYARL